MTLHPSVYLWLFLTFTLSHIAAQLFAIAVRPWVLRKPTTAVPTTAPTAEMRDIAREAVVRAQRQIADSGRDSDDDDGGEAVMRLPRREAGYMSGVRNVRRRSREAGE